MYNETLTVGCQRQRHIKIRCKDLALYSSEEFVSGQAMPFEKENSQQVTAGNLQNSRVLTL
jgi:hypothetical protein